MSVSKFTEEVREEILEILGEGRPLREAAYSVEVAEKTLKNWIARGRRERDEDLESDYVAFVDAVEKAREDHRDRERPMTIDELRLEVSRSAKKGSVQAQKLLWDMIRAEKFPDPEETEGEEEQAPQGAPNGFAELDGEDELSKQRRQKAGS